jgi:peptidoglycan/xylan/chitin deacetylase (PgdA/CDA1 family)
VSSVIGVIAKADETPEVEEFFELFKTPWEFYRPGRQYDVVVTTACDIPEVDARLLVVYGSDIKSSDASNGIAAHLRRPGIRLKYQGILLPLYGDGLTFQEVSTATPCVATDFGAAGLQCRFAHCTMVRLGYDLFQEVRCLLSAGQTLENAHIPTLDMHIRMLRDWILNAGIDLLEIPPAPAGHSFIVCLTHDIDFVGIRYHRFDHSMWGFLYRSTIGAIRNLLKRRISITRLLKIWRAALSLPFVLLGWAKDFWEPFDWYLRVEENLPATYFLIPFRGRPGERAPGRTASRRATAYDITDIPQWTATLLRKGCELGVHGIDSWHDVEKGREELARIASVTGKSGIGIRMHWLLYDQNTFRILEEAGYAYDSSVGYNETTGYRSGTTQVFRPLGTRTFLELPMHIQDGAMFYAQRLDLSESEAWRRCGDFIDNARKFGGCLTVLWHDRSHGPERYWGDFYIRLIQALKSLDGWFGTASQTVNWFRKRREVRFEVIEDANGTARTCLRYHGEEIWPPLKIRVHHPLGGAKDSDSRGGTTPSFVDIPWNGVTGDELDRVLGKACEYSGKPAEAESQTEIRELRDRTGLPARFLS